MLLRGGGAFADPSERRRILRDFVKDGTVPEPKPDKGSSSSPSSSKPPMSAVEALKKMGERIAARQEPDV